MIFCFMFPVPTGVLTFKRQVVRDGPKWETSQATLTRLHVTSAGMIEDEGAGMLQVEHWRQPEKLYIKHKENCCSVVTKLHVCSDWEVLDRNPSQVEFQWKCQWDI